MDAENTGSDAGGGGHEKSGSEHESIVGTIAEVWWKTWVPGTWIVWAMKNPWDFAYYFFISVAPLLVIAGLALWKFSKVFQGQANKDKKRSPKKSSGGGGGGTKGRPSRTLRSNSTKSD